MFADEPLLALAATGDSSSGFKWLPAEDAHAGATVLYAPLHAVGDFRQTGLSILNLDAAPGAVVLRLVGDNGEQVRQPHAGACSLRQSAHLLRFQRDIPHGFTRAAACLQNFDRVGRNSGNPLKNKQIGLDGLRN